METRKPQPDPWTEQTLTHRQIRELDLHPLTFDVEGMLSNEGAPAIVFGGYGTGKSALVHHLCRCLATGEPFLGSIPVRKYDEVRFINIDDDERAVKRRFKALGQHDPPLDNLTLTHLNEFNLIDFGYFMQHHQGAFVAIDCWADTFNPGDGEQGSEMHHAIKQIRDVYQRNGCGGIIIDHAKKDSFDKNGNARRGATYGSVFKPAKIRQMWEVRRPDKIGDIVTIFCEKPGGYAPFEDVYLTLRFVDGEPVFARIEPPPPPEPPGPSTEDLVRELLAQDPTMTGKQIAEKLDMSDGYIGKLLAKIRKERPKAPQEPESI